MALMVTLASESHACGSAHAMAEVARRSLARLRRQVDSWFTADGNNTDYDPLLEVPPHELCFSGVLSANMCQFLSWCDGRKARCDPTQRASPLFALPPNMA